MKIACFADTHGRSFASGIESDIIIHAGDVYDKNHYTPESIIPEQLTYAVRGNHDGKDWNDFWKKAIDPSGTILEIGEKLYLCGLGFAAPKFYDLPDEKALKVDANKLIYSKRPNGILIFLTHYPPSTIPIEGNPEGWFYDTTRDIIEALSPEISICGHVHHKSAKCVRLPSTLILFPSARGIVLDYDLLKGICVEKAL